MMSIKNKIVKFLKWVLTPRGVVTISISQISHGGILKDKRILITGGGSGLGLAMAKKFVSEGAKIVIVGRNEERLKKAMESLGSSCSYIPFDVTNVKELPALLIKADSIMGGLDCVVSNAGVSLHEGDLSKVTVSGYEKQMDINLKSNVFLCQSFVNMKLSSNKDILIISSMTGNMPSDIPYGLSKAALNSFIQKVSQRYYKDGVRINAIAPGMIPTDLTSSYIDTSDGNFFCKESCGRYFLPEEIAEVATFLLSDASRIIAGEVITCDGGYSSKSIWK